MTNPPVDMEGLQGEVAQNARTGERDCPCLGGVGCPEAPEEVSTFLVSVLLILNPVSKHDGEVGSLTPIAKELPLGFPVCDS